MSTHDYVCLADEDISFRHFDMDAYWQRMHRAFTRGPPLVSQPLIEATATDGLTSYFLLLTSYFLLLTSYFLLLTYCFLGDCY